MTRRDYVLMAECFHTAITKTRNADECSGVERAMLAFCNRLSDDNPRFDSQRFYDACWFPELDNVSSETNTTTKEGK